MKLRTKLLLGVALLLLVMAAVLYLLPTLLIRKDIYKAADSVHNLVLEQREQLKNSQLRWLNEALAQTKKYNDAFLLMLYELPGFGEQLILQSGSDNIEEWRFLANATSFSPSIGFLQSHNRENGLAGVVKPAEGNLYVVEKSLIQGNNRQITLMPTQKEQEQKEYIGLPLPKAGEHEEGYTFYALIDPQKLGQLQAKWESVVAKSSGNYPSGPERFATPHAGLEQSDNRSILEWGVKIHLLERLAPLFAAAYHEIPDSETFLPEGLARLDKTGNGWAILSAEVFATEPLLNDVKYYELHQPLHASYPPLGAGEFLLPLKEGVYLGNTVILNQALLSIGAPIDNLARQLALSMNKSVLLRANQNFWLGFDNRGERLGKEQVQQWVASGDFEQSSGNFDWAGNTYNFMKLGDLEGGNLTFFEVQYFEKQRSVIATLLSLEDKLSRRISLQLLAVALATMLATLFFIGRIGYTIIYPITRLARATQEVVAGRFDEISLPDVGNRQDEVATLTRAFDEMVKGLEEREKIRGVLDKVVSKDVADEILKTNIHLGGEDRIASILFGDIRGFSSITANLSPQDTIHILNACMTKVSRVIEAEGGVIDKYVGDEVMGIYGAPAGHPDHALRAVSSGMLIIETLKKWNQSRKEAKEPLIEMGIGVHTGLVVAGNMGAEDRLNYTVLGANVNLAARLCEYAKPNQLIISEGTLAQPNVEESFYTVPLPPIILKGFQKPVQIYEVTGFKWDEN